MEGGNKKKEVYFHSHNIKDTASSKSKEADLFVNKRKVSSLEKTLDKIIVSKTPKKEKKPPLKERIKTVLKKVNFKKIGLIAGIVLLFLATGGYFGFIFIDEHFIPTDYDQNQAISFLENEPKKGIKTIEKLINQSAKTNEEKAGLYTIRASELFYYHKDKYKSQVLNDAYAAEKLVATKSTAIAISNYESAYNNNENSQHWSEIANSRKEEL